MANASVRKPAPASIDTRAIAAKILNLRTMTLERTRYTNAIFVAVHKLAHNDPHTVADLASLGCYLSEGTEGEVEHETDRISVLLSAGNDRTGVTDE
jgi:hypothetical protein